MSRSRQPVLRAAMIRIQWLPPPRCPRRSIETMTETAKIMAVFFYEGTVTKNSTRKSNRKQKII